MMMMTMMMMTVVIVIMMIVNSLMMMNPSNIQMLVSLFSEKNITLYFAGSACESPQWSVLCNRQPKVVAQNHNDDDNDDNDDKIFSKNCIDDDNDDMVFSGNHIDDNEYDEIFHVVISLSFK